MSESTLYWILGILTLVLIPLLLSYWYLPDEEEKKLAVQSSQAPQEEEVFEGSMSFERIARIFAQSSSSKAELKEAIEQLVRHHGKIHAKLGDLPHPDFKRYMTLVIDLSKNPTADKDLILALDQKLKAKNPKYVLEIDEAVNKGLAGRGF